MSERAAVLRAIGKPLDLENIELEPIAADQVRVRIAASGVCHSDLSQATGALPAGTPCVLGHEGAGVVEDVGSEVHHVQRGDHVVIAWTAACGRCWFCQRGEVHLCQNSVADSYSMPYAKDRDGTALYTSVGVSSFATATNCLGRAVVPIPSDVPLEIAALIGCGVATGAGAAFNTAPVEHGASVAVMGLGGVGLASLMAAGVRGAAQIIAVDPAAARRELAASLGATDLIDPADGDVAKQVRAVTGRRGADIVFEAVGRSATIDAAVRATRRGGTTCVVGAAMPGDDVSLSAFHLFMDAKTLVGCQYGSVVPTRDFPLLLDLWRAGRLPLERLISRRVPLDNVNEAFDDLAAGRGIRTVIVNN
ncbi:Zn-dependent alcohol dehydrogenase [Mycobacterium vicinigordonae]|uniref:Zn-dependent alcohol dehydrogenase n=1 Tax=Mycobacterium vicinigordonae TaxID=1719132 RepID=A0A7D6HSC0_9MYCO|nr:Zn-dependent alcohol dehydrogenase [Mycobacterium vicinigordonae]QLL05373.1 Zn-dependent alcohol dehydrogenase [Mycobacterium vicinigordonae]